ncbi:MAG: MFS transporter [Cytophagales bacterium]|nr:MAG: MFS transporter [Cytophagales bacterium]TAF60584.1 MAG: MFS transporter [Cytophagales bacterium]
MEKNNPKTINGWAMYDWANSVYNLVITTAIFPIYYNAATESAFGGSNVQFFGISLDKTALYSFSLSFSFALIALISPLLSGMADYGGKKKVFLQFFTYVGALACMGLYFFTGSNIELGILASVVACLGFAGGQLFYNAFLPEIATPDRVDAVSAKGFAYGYIGSVILLILSLVMIEMHTVFGFDNKGLPTRLSFVMVGLWWIGFAQIPFRVLHDLPAKVQTGSLFAKGFEEVLKVWHYVRHNQVMRLYLLSFLFFNMGVQTIMLLATSFGQEELGLETGELIAVLLAIQLVAIGGAYFFAWVAERVGNKHAIASMLVIWTVVCLVAYFVRSSAQFYALAVVVGLMMGGIQSLARSTFSRLIPDDSLDTASFFSFFNVADKVAYACGTFVFAFVVQLTGSMRNGALAMSVFFVIGLGILLATKLEFSKKQS